MIKRTYMTMLMMALALAVLGCAKVHPKVAASQPGARTARAIALESAVEKFAEQTRTLKALAWVELASGDEDRQTETALVISRPGGFRLDAMDQLADVWASAGTDGKRMWLFIPSKQKLYSGSASKKNLHRLAKFDWDVPELVSVMAGSLPMAGNGGFTQLLPSREGHFVAANGLHVWADKKKDRPVRCVRYGDGGEVNYEVTFADYRPDDGVDFPHRIEAAFPGDSAGISVVYRDVIFGDDVDPLVFLPPKSGRGHVVDLKD